MRRLFALLVLGLALTTPARADAALPVFYNSAKAVAASLGAPGAAPPGANDWSCRSAKRPVILLHGTHVNMLLNWNTLSPLLKNNGYCVFALNYGGLRLGQIGGTGDIPTSGAELVAFVNRVLAKTGARQVDLVGHSLGGTLAQYYVKFLGGAPKVHDIVGLGPTSHGSSALGFDAWIRALLTAFPKLAGFISSVDPAALQQLRGSAFITKLNSLPDTVPGVRYTTIATRYDAVVTPYTSQFLSGANVNNVVLQDICANDFADHLALAFDHVALRVVLNALDPSTARRPSCATPVLPVIGG
ncbi:alpha/beta fold hydrolase [Allokutzneria sp. A3M-2-11 16]|uniref:esterase/lipase family protein n=1 Tax=Allokutzneria sp. A3M-2-11 16 TaxID=2962043 RepID=UPI0020B7E550|nr:alpha/beta fold hydrolase [Allokutzneria sp. A3M-2-11 16]MCP3798361.1 alpha/beta fold hydrolase [Allokutzneria sp. A3M-2-11 16]